MSIELFKALVDEMRKIATEEREVSYSEGAVGITALLYCPKKFELKFEYPEIQAESAEVDDGLAFEYSVKQALKRLFGNNAIDEFVLHKRINGLTIEGHLDALINKGDELIGIEIKAPRLLKTKNGFRPNGERIIVDDGTKFQHSESYVLQARIQKRILQDMFPKKKVRTFLFYKTLIKHDKGHQKAFVVYEVKDPISAEELEKLVERFKNDKRPRYDWECTEKYCAYKKAGVCNGPDEKKEKEDWLSDLLG